MPGMYGAGDYDLAGFCVGAVDRAKALTGNRVEPGDVMLGLASSGVHSNGFSLVRRLVANSGLRYDAPAPFETEESLGDALLTPTRIYVKPLLHALRQVGGIKAMAHITGGGFTDNIPRALPEGAAAGIDLSRIPVPSVFRWLAREGAIPEAEMLRTFNCGVGMIVIAEADAAAAVSDSLSDYGETVVDLGRVENRTGAPVVFQGALSLGRT
jgi:phosphoribosylformylglycinamidine cyclo-ligase